MSRSWQAPACDSLHCDIPAIPYLFVSDPAECSRVSCSLVPECSRSLVPDPLLSRYYSYPLRSERENRGSGNETRYFTGELDKLS